MLGSRAEFAIASACGPLTSSRVQRISDSLVEPSGASHPPKSTNKKGYHKGSLFLFGAGVNLTILRKQAITILIALLKL